MLAILKVEKTVVRTNDLKIKKINIFQFLMYSRGKLLCKPIYLKRTILINKRLFLQIFEITIRFQKTKLGDKDWTDILLVLKLLIFLLLGHTGYS